MINLKGLKLGVALCGSYCTYKTVFIELEKLIESGVEIYPIMSENAYKTDTRFGKAKDFISRLENLSGRKVIHSIVDVEPLGPMDIIDALLIAPCTGNSMAKLAAGVTDTTVTMAAKGLLRNKKPIIIALATNDGLGLNLKNMAQLLSLPSLYFVPLGQDSYLKKPYSLVSHMELISETLKNALEYQQLQPILRSYQQ